MALRQLFDTWRSIRLPWRREVLVGIDSKGNEYYESLWKRESEYTGRTRRWVKIPNHREELYEEDMIPVQWQSWLRHRRIQPPTEQEIYEANLRRAQIVERAKLIEEQWLKRKLELNEQARQQAEKEALKGGIRESGVLPKEENLSRRELLQRQRLASQLNPHPSGRGDTFEPGSWVPDLTINPSKK